MYFFSGPMGPITIGFGSFYLFFDCLWRVRNCGTLQVHAAFVGEDGIQVAGSFGNGFFGNALHADGGSGASETRFT